MIALLWFVLAILASPFKSKSRLEAANATWCLIPGETPLCPLQSDRVAYRVFTWLMEVTSTVITLKLRSVH